MRSWLRQPFDHAGAAVAGVAMGGDEDLIRGWVVRRVGMVRVMKLDGGQVAVHTETFLDVQQPGSTS